MWRNGSGHRAVRASGPRRQASNADTAKKNTNKQGSINQVMAAMMTGDPQEEQRKLLSAKIDANLHNLIVGGPTPQAPPASTATAPSTASPLVTETEDATKKQEAAEEALRLKREEIARKVAEFRKTMEHEA